MQYKETSKVRNCVLRARNDLKSCCTRVFFISSRALHNSYSSSIFSICLCREAELKRHVVVKGMRLEKKDAEICGAALLIAASGDILFIQKRNVMHLCAWQTVSQCALALQAKRSPSIYTHTKRARKINHNSTARCLDARALSFKQMHPAVATALSGWLNDTGKNKRYQRQPHVANSNENDEK